MKNHIQASATRLGLHELLLYLCETVCSLTLQATEQEALTKAKEVQDLQVSILSCL